jgi:hypothetical protein
VLLLSMNGYPGNLIIGSSYGRDLLKLRSASVTYQPGQEKQPDASFRPRDLPAPDGHNRLMYQPNTFRHFPTIVYEVAVTNENHNRLLSDANDKYFAVHTSVAIWVRVKIDLNQNLFWAGWVLRSKQKRQQVLRHTYPSIFTLGLDCLDNSQFPPPLFRTLFLSL